MKQYKIKKQKPDLTDAQINRHKDFGGLMASYQEVTQGRHRVPLYKNRKMFFLLLLVALVVWLMTMSEEEKEKPIQNEPEPSEQVTQP